MLGATTACTFSSLIWPAGSAPAALASLLFDPPEPQIIGKTQWIATFSVSRRSYLFAHLHLLSSDLFSSDSSHLCFSTVHIVGSFTSKLPSINYIYYIYCTSREARRQLPARRRLRWQGRPSVSPVRTDDQLMIVTVVTEFHHVSSNDVESYWWGFKMI